MGARWPPALLPPLKSFTLHIAEWPAAVMGCWPKAAQQHHLSLLIEFDLLKKERRVAFFAGASEMNGQLN